MEYNYVTKKCDCPSTYRQAGGHCVLQTDYDSMNNWLSSTQGQEITYYELTENNGVPFTQASDIFSQFYVKSAIGCKLYRDPI